MASRGIIALGGGGRQTATVTPGSSSRKTNGARGRTETKTTGKSLTARDIMQGKTLAPVKKERDDYPGLGAILQTSRKMKPFLSTDLEQAQRALDSMLPLGTFPRMREILQARLKADLIDAVAKWRADNWLLPVDKETEFPYARTRNLVTPLEKYGNLWIPKHYDSGFWYDSEGESIGFPRFMENCNRANAVEMIDLAIKGVDQWWAPDVALLEKMKAENIELKKLHANTEFDRHEEVRRCYRLPGYMISGRFMAFKLFSKEQQKLLDAYTAKSDADTKKALLQHVYKHGQLVHTCPEEDSYVKSKVVAAPKKVVSPQVGSVMDSVDA